MAHLHYSKTRKHIFSLIISLCFLPSICSALSSDAKQVAQIKADSAEYNEKTGVSTYSGHIKADQGSTHLTAAKVKVFHNKENRIEKIIAFGQPAQYQTTPDGKQHPLTATADQIIYYPSQSKVILLGHGKVSHSGNYFTGPHIEYSMIAQRIISFPDQHGRTTITLTPAHT